MNEKAFRNEYTREGALREVRDRKDEYGCPRGNLFEYPQPAPEFASPGREFFDDAGEFVHVGAEEADPGAEVRDPGAGAAQETVPVAGEGGQGRGGRNAKDAENAGKAAVKRSAAKHAAFVARAAALVVSVVIIGVVIAESGSSVALSEFFSEFLYGEHHHSHGDYWDSEPWFGGIDDIIPGNSYKFLDSVAADVYSRLEDGDFLGAAEIISENEKELAKGFSKLTLSSANIYYDGEKVVNDTNINLIRMKIGYFLYNDEDTGEEKVHLLFETKEHNTGAPGMVRIMTAADDQYRCFEGELDENKNSPHATRLVFNYFADGRIMNLAMKVQGALTGGIYTGEVTDYSYDRGNDSTVPEGARFDDIEPKAHMVYHLTPRGTISLADVEYKEFDTDGEFYRQDEYDYGVVEDNEYRYIIVRGTSESGESGSTNYFYTHILRGDETDELFNLGEFLDTMW
ncbi:MAG: hypothetical protein J6X47_08775 [Clostridia bacterium]|nr:hypothetical protein [Clostridia bacterium]